MAALMIRSSGLLRRCPAQQCMVRYQSKKKEPEDMSWAAPIFERHQEKQSVESQQPSPLHMVCRVKGLKGRPYWEKEVMKKFGLDGPKYKPVVIKNTPTVNGQLSVVKHLVRILPVKFPFGLPEDESDFEHCVLQDNGEFVVQKRIHPVSKEEFQVVPESEPTVWKMDRETRDKQCRRKLDMYDLNSEYFRPEINYRKNQDGKEWLYHGNQNIGRSRKF